MQNLKEFTCLNGGTFGEGAGMVNAIQAAKSLYTCPPHSQCESISDLNWRLTKDLKKVKFEVHHLMP